MSSPSSPVSSPLEEAVDWILASLGRDLVVGMPLGIGKPNPLVNALYQRACDDRSITLKLLTALSLEVPTGKSDLERRFMRPFAQRHFGADYPSLKYVTDLRRNALPSNITVSEFYLLAGEWLDSPHLQQNFISSNYTHVVRDMLDQGINLMLQMVAAEGQGAERRYSLSGNPDITLGLARSLAARPEKPFRMVAQVNEHLPFMTGDAEVSRDFFDLLVDSRQLDFPLFALPRARVSTVDYAIGMHASSLVRDGGTLQLGIGALGDAIVRALQLRHDHNEQYRDLLDALCGEPGWRARQCLIGGDERFSTGLYAATEMFMDGFMHLYRSGILKRRAYHDLEVQQLAIQGVSEDELNARFGTTRAAGSLLDAAFFLGSREFYDWLHNLTPREREAFRMTSVDKINQLYGKDQQLKRLQRHEARFLNTAMKMTLLGAAVSDALEDQRVVSGVGGQYNFVAMAHALEQGRSILMLRSGHESSAGRQSSIVWRYGHTTIPRHLRDIVVTEYGVADLRGKSDQEVIKAMLAVTDSRDQPELLDTAQAAGKLPRDHVIAERHRHNTPQRLHEVFSQAAAAEHFLDYPFGSDFTDDERVLLGALTRLKNDARSIAGIVGLVMDALRSNPRSTSAQRYLQRMNLAKAHGLRQRIQQRMLAARLPRQPIDND